MSEWISVKDRLPSLTGGPCSWKQCLVAISYGRRPVEWREAIWESGEFRSPYENPHTGGRSPFRNVTHWREVNDLPPPPEPQLTVKEALREATDMLSHLHGVGYDKKDGTWYMPTAWMVKVAPLLPRLRAALEAE